MEQYSIENEDESEQVFSKLVDCGYSELVAKRIYQWYHPK